MARSCGHHTRRECPAALDVWEVVLLFAGALLFAGFLTAMSAVGFLWLLELIGGWAR